MIDLIAGLVAGLTLSALVWTPVFLILNRTRRAQQGIPQRRRGRAHPDDYGGIGGHSGTGAPDGGSFNDYDHEMFSDVDEGAGE
jgi:hypothetical protein